MSIDSLQADLKGIIVSAPKFSPLEGDYSEKVDNFLHNQLLPYLENQVGEMVEQDNAIYALVHQTEDILHTENAALFMGLIEAAEQLVGELRTRVGNDHRILGLITAWKRLALQAKEVIEDIGVPDDDDDPDVEEDEPDVEDPPEASK